MESEIGSFVTRAENAENEIKRLVEELELLERANTLKGKQSTPASNSNQQNPNKPIKGIYELRITSYNAVKCKP